MEGSPSVRKNGLISVNVLGLLFQDAVTLCTLGIGTAFGESILNDTPRHATVITSEYCELLRVEQKDFGILWEVRKEKAAYTSGKQQPVRYSFIWFGVTATLVCLTCHM